MGGLSVVLGGECGMSEGYRSVSGEEGGYDVVGEGIWGGVVGLFVVLCCVVLRVAVMDQRLLVREEERENGWQMMVSVG